MVDSGIDYTPPRIDRLADFRVLVREDWHANRATLREPGFQALLMYRFGCLRRSRALRGGGVRRLARGLMWVMYRWAHFRVRRLHGIELHDTAIIGRRVAIRHQGMIVIGAFVRIGDDSMIRHGVTIGGANPEWVPGVGPRLGRRVTVGANAVVVGPVTIGDDAMIGPNVTVFFDVEPGTKIVAHRPRVIEGALDASAD